MPVVTVQPLEGRTVEQTRETDLTITSVMVRSQKPA
jgi:hypothetical protein